MNKCRRSMCHRSRATSQLTSPHTNVPSQMLSAPLCLSRSVSHTFIAAIIANADVPYSLRTRDWEAAAGLLQYGGGRKAGTVAVPNLRGDGIEFVRVEYAWRQVLAGRPLRAAEPPPPIDSDPTRIINTPRHVHVGTRTW